MKIGIGMLLILISAIVLVGIGNALTPPPPPPPPVQQNLGFYDTGVDQLQTNASDQSACRQCHQTSGTNVTGGGTYNNTIGGVPTRHHTLVQRGVTNPYTNVPFLCTDCHPTSASLPNGMLLDRSCLDCHNGTNFWADSTLGARVGNISRPHHFDTANDTAKIGTPAANRTCNFCHGSFVNNYNDGHYKPSYATDFMITPYATFKVTNFSQPDGLGGNKTWGGCESCHMANPNAMLPVFNNQGSHHDTLCIGLWHGCNGPGPWLTSSCTWCHVIYIDPLGGCPAQFENCFSFNTISPITGEQLFNVTEVRNSTIENADFAIGALEPGTTNMSVNGTGCEKCHGVQSLHNIQFNYSQNGPQGLGHINNNSDCSGCHDSWLPASSLVPGALVPYVDNIAPSVIAEKTTTVLTITGSNFMNDVYTSVVVVDGVKYTPTSITDSQIVVNIPPLDAGVHIVQLVKGEDTLSKLSTLTVVPSTSITSAKVKKGVITINGKGFGTKPTNAQLYVSVNHAGDQIVSTSITGWSNTQISAQNSAAAIGDVVTVMTTNSGEDQTVITK